MLKKIESNLKESMLKKEEVIKKNQIEINNQKNILKEEEIKKKIKQLNELVKNYNNFREKEMNNFIKLVDQILGDYVKKNAIDLVLNKKDILMGKNKYNITSEILDLVNKSVK